MFLVHASLGYYHSACVNTMIFAQVNVFQEVSSEDMKYLRVGFQYIEIAKKLRLKYIFKQ